MPIFGWIRDALGIGKDVVDTKKARLEIKKLEDERREKIIFPATMGDVEKYDPAYRALRARIEADIGEKNRMAFDPRPCPESSPTRLRVRVKILLGLLSLLLILATLYLLRR